jgi:exosortase
LSHSAASDVSTDRPGRLAGRRAPPFLVAGRRRWQRLSPSFVRLVLSCFDREEPFRDTDITAMSTASPHAVKARGLGFADLNDFDEDKPLDPSSSKLAWIAFGALVALLVLSYGNMLSYTSTYWSKGLYSHGWIVPLFSAYLLWIRYRPLTEASQLERWGGVALIAVCLGIRLWSSYYDYNNPDRASFIGALLGVCLLIGGKRMLRWAGPPLLFLAFMFPLPNVLETTLLMKLQTYATMLSTWTLQTLGVSAARVGNMISIDRLDEPLQVAEACAGLRMLTIFGAMTVALVMIIERPWWDKLVILLSWIPIALISNMIRIVTTALLFMAFGQDTKWVNQIIHDWAGFAMMPIGLGLLWLELTVLSRLTIPLDETGEFASFGAAPA